MSKLLLILAVAGGAAIAIKFKDIVKYFLKDSNADESLEFPPSHVSQYSVSTSKPKADNSFDLGRIGGLYANYDILPSETKSFERLLLTITKRGYLDLLKMVIDNKNDFDYLKKLVNEYDVKIPEYQILPGNIISNNAPVLSEVDIDSLLRANDLSEALNLPIDEKISSLVNWSFLGSFRKFSDKYGECLLNVIESKNSNSFEFKSLMLNISTEYEFLS